MNLPILGTLSALFTDAGSEFRKLLEPWALVVAAIFLGLGLGFIYLPLRPYVASLRIWESWDAAWQLLAGTVALFALAYLINSLSGAFLALAGGQMLRNAPLLGRALVGGQSRRFNTLTARAAAGGPDGDRAFYRLAYEFPAAGTLAATRLGNARAAVVTYGLNQYGAHLDTVWPLLAQTLAEKDDKLLEQVRAEQTATTFLATLGILLALMALLAAPLALAQTALAQAAWGRALLAMALLPLAYGVYYAAAVRALNWGRLLRAALDLHLDETGTRLGLRDLAGDPAAKRARWAAVSRWLAYGGLSLDMAQVRLPTAQADWYEKPAPAAPATLTCSPHVAASIHVAQRPPEAFELTTKIARLPQPTYEVFVMAAQVTEPGVSAPPAAPPAAGGFLRVSDSRLPHLPPAVGGTLYWPDGTTTPELAVVSADLGGPDALLWPLPELAARGSGVLRYTVAAECRLRAGTGVELLAVAPAPSNRAGQLAVELRYAADAAGPAVLYAEPLAAGRAGDSFAWAAVVDGVPDRPRQSAPVYDPVQRRVAWRIPAATPNSVYFITLALAGHGLA